MATQRHRRAAWLATATLAVVACATYSEKTQLARDAAQTGDLAGSEKVLNRFLGTKDSADLPAEWKKETIVALLATSGSISISVLSASPLAKGLFLRAIGQSGGLLEPVEIAPPFALDGAEKYGAAFAAKLGAPSLAALRAKPAAEIANARYSPNAVIDGYVLREPTFNAFAAGRGNDIDLLIGSNADEGGVCRQAQHHGRDVARSVAPRLPILHRLADRP